MNPLVEFIGTGHQVAPMLRLHLLFPGGWYTAKSWIAPNVFMLPISRSTFPVPWRPNGTTLPASQPTSARRPECWWYYKGEHWKSSGEQWGRVVTLPYCYFMCGQPGAQNKLHTCMSSVSAAQRGLLGARTLVATLWPRVAAVACTQVSSLA